MLILEKNGHFAPKSHYSPYEKDVMAYLALWKQERSLTVKTSGSTGIPKSIYLAENQILASINQTKNAFELTAETILFCCLSVDYIAGKLMLLRAFELGLEAWIVEPSANPFETLTSEQKQYFLTNNQPFFMAFVPLQIQAILSDEASRNFLAKARNVLIGGAGIAQNIEKQLAKLHLDTKFWLTYGMTETVTHIAIRRADQWLSSPIFQTLQGIEIRQEANGCLAIRGPTTNHNWLVSNDVVKITSPTSFELLGRLDAVVNSGGIKIQLEEVERLIQTQLPAQLQAARYFCTGIPHPTLGSEIVLFIETIHPINNQWLLNLKEFLPKYHAPRRVIAVKEFVNLPSGKIDKRRTTDENLPT